MQQSMSLKYEPSSEPLHIEQVCDFATAQCKNAGCKAALLVRDVAGHAATCEHRVAPCIHCRFSI